jgi:hypothetical protein
MMSWSAPFIVRNDITFRDVYDAWIAVRIIHRLLNNYIFFAVGELFPYFGREFLFRVKKVEQGYLLPVDALVKASQLDNIVEACQLYVLFLQITIEPLAYETREEGYQAYREYMTAILDQLNSTVNANVHTREQLIDWVLELNRKYEEIAHQKTVIERSHLDGAVSPLPIWQALVESELLPSERVTYREDSEEKQLCDRSQGLRDLFVELYGSDPYKWWEQK